jgi:hypothetical protein
MTDHLTCVDLAGVFTDYTLIEFIGNPPKFDATKEDSGDRKNVGDMSKEDLEEFLKDKNVGKDDLKAGNGGTLPEGFEGMPERGENTETE